MTLIIPRGIYAPTLTFFLDDAKQSVDIPTAAKHAVRLAKAGLKGVVLQGSTGEAVHLTREERVEIIKGCRKALDEAGFKDFKIIAGMGGQSLNETLDLAADAKAAGADAGLAVPPSYFAGQMTPDVLVEYFTKLARQTELPFMVYNFPGVTNGINIMGPTLARLAAEPNIIGCKLTCNTIGKMTYLSAYAGNLPEGYGEFGVFTGGSDFLIAAHAAGVAGAITGMSNQFPYTLVALWNACEAGDIKRAQQLQAVVTRAENAIVPGFIPVSRALLRATVNYGGKSRSPLPEVEDSSVTGMYKEIWALEQSLAKGA